jgi:hypothetical protein
MEFTRPFIFPLISSLYDVLGVYFHKAFLTSGTDLGLSRQQLTWVGLRPAQASIQPYLTKIQNQTHFQPVGLVRQNLWLIHDFAKLIQLRALHSSQSSMPEQRMAMHFSAAASPLAYA